MSLLLEKPARRYGLSDQEQADFESLSFSPTGYAAAVTRTSEEDWEMAAGPSLGFGQEFWVQNRQTCQRMYICRNGSQIDHDLQAA